MFETREKCKPDEIAAQVCYLNCTPVRGIAELLMADRCRLSRASVTSLAALGALKTEFGQIGSHLCSSKSGIAKFSVAEVLQLLRKDPNADPAMHASIEALMLLDKEGRVDYNITLFLMGNEAIIKDGNKRTIAYYAVRNGGEDRIVYPVFIVEPNASGV